MIALLVVVAALFWTHNRNKQLGAALAVTACLVLLGVGSARMTTFAKGEESANQRFMFWNNGLHYVLKDHPVIGVGYLQFPEYNDTRAAHSTFVQCFTETGLVGYFLWMGCLHFGFRRRQVTEEVPRVPWAESELLGARIALLGMLAAAFWLSRLYTPTTTLLIALPIMAHYSLFDGNTAMKYPWPTKADLKSTFRYFAGTLLLIELMIRFYLV
jgi:putative inorganic carbon (hco3(-)) transporter